MSREEAEKKVAENLEEILKVVKDYMPGVGGSGLSIGVNTDGYWAFELEKDKKNEPMPGEYLFYVSRFEL